MLRSSILGITRSLQNFTFNSVRTISTTQCLSGRYTVKTQKRRKTFPFHWLPKSTIDVSFPTDLSKDNEKFVDDLVKDRFSLKPGQTPLKYEPFPRGTYEPGSQRCGVIAKKLGHYPMWTKTGQRILTTALQIVDNHVVSYTTNEKDVQQRRPFYARHKFAHLDTIVVGAESADPRSYPTEYLNLFQKAAIPPKKKLTKFFITRNAALAPGTPLDARHFRVGDYVDCWGKTKDRGFQGVMVRWKFKGQPKFQGVTKAHRRPGSIACGRKLMGPPKGKKMAGHMGCERRVLKGLRIWRINYENNVVFVHGPAVPGDNGAYVYIYDTTIKEKKYKDDNVPPFPTYFADDESPKELPSNAYHDELHAFDSPSLLFEETEEEKRANAAALRAAQKKAKIAKIR